MYYPSSKNKGADQLRGYREADICAFVFAYADYRFSHVTAHFFHHELTNTLHKSEEEE